MNGWLAKCDLTIQGSRIDFDVTNLPLMLNETHLPPELLAGCKADGGDIRFTDTDGTTELAREIVHFDKEAGTMFIYVRIPSLVAATDKVITVWWANASEGEPVDTSASGSKTVWDDYYGVYHFQNMSADFKSIKDSAGKWSNFTAIGEPVSSDGHAPNTIAATIDADVGIDCNEPYFWGTGLKDFMTWQRPAIDDVIPSGVLATSVSGGGPAFGYASTERLGISWVTYMKVGIDGSAWTHVLFQVGPYGKDGGNTGTWYKNCEDVTEGGGKSFGKADLYRYFGPLKGGGVKFSEMRMTREKTLPINYYKVIMALESNPTGIVVPGTPETSSVKNELTLTGLIPNTEVRIYDATTGVEEDGVENSTNTFTWEFEMSGSKTINIHIHNPQYDFIAFRNLELTGNATIPIQQIKARYKLDT